MGKRRIAEKERTPKIHKTRQHDAKKSRQKTPEVQRMPSSPAYISQRIPTNQSTPKHQVKPSTQLFQTPQREEFFLLSQTDTQADVAWDCNSPDALRQIKLVKNGKSGENIADLVKILADEDLDLPPAAPPLLGLWLNKEQDDDIKRNIRPHKNKAPRKKSSMKVPVLSTQLFEQLSAAILRQNNNETDKIKEEESDDGARSSIELFSDDSEESGKETVMNLRSAAAKNSPQIDAAKFTGIKHSGTNNCSDLDDSWADGDDLFNDSSFIFQATQMPAMQSPCTVTRSKSLLLNAKANSPVHFVATGSQQVTQATNKVLNSSRLQSGINNGLQKQSLKQACSSVPMKSTSNVNGSCAHKANNATTLFKIPTTKQLTTNSNGYMQQSKQVPGSTLSLSRSVTSGRPSAPGNRLVKPLTQTQTVVPPSQGLCKPLHTGNSITSIGGNVVKSCSNTLKYSFCKPASVVTRASANTTAVTGNIGAKRGLVAHGGHSNVNVKKPNSNIKLGDTTKDKGEKKNSSLDWDNSLTDELLSQLLEPDEFLESQVLPGQQASISNIATNVSTKSDSSDTGKGQSNTVKPLTEHERGDNGNVQQSKSNESMFLNPRSSRSKITTHHAVTSNTIDNSVHGDSVKALPRALPDRVHNQIQSKHVIPQSSDSRPSRQNVVVLPRGAPDRVEETQSMSDDDVLSQPAVLAMLDQIEAQPGLSQQCTPGEIERKKQEALKRRTLKNKTGSERSIRRS